MYVSVFEHVTINLKITHAVMKATYN